MKSPCHDCTSGDTDKNNSICLKCEARVKYAQGLNACLDPSIKIERRFVMSKRGTCKNCERSDMLLPGFGRCWVCYDAGRNADSSGASVEAALAAAKDKIKNSKFRKSRKRIGGTSEAQATRDSAAAELLRQQAGKTELKPVTYKIGIDRSIPGVDVVSLEFKDERGKDLLRKLREKANTMYRDLEQQMLWMLQGWISAEEEASKDEKTDVPKPYGRIS